MLTLRQIEVIRAVMMTGTLAGAAKLLNVSAPGISRLMKHTEQSLGMKLFDKRGGRLVPSAAAQEIFEQINVVFSRIEDLRYVIGKVNSGTSQELRIGAAPSISQVMVPRAIELLLARFPDLMIDINLLKIEEAVDYLLLGKGEVVAMSSRFDHPALNPEAHPLAKQSTISAAEIIHFPLIGIHQNDPYGRIVADIFRQRGLEYQLKIRARFGSTVCSLVKAGLGIAVIDQFTIADGAISGIKAIEIEDRPPIQTWIITKAGASPSVFATTFVQLLRRLMTSKLGRNASASGRQIR